MPYVSKVQAAKFHADPKLRKYAAEFDQATIDAGGFGKLPMRVRRKKSPRRQYRKGSLATALGGHR